MVIWGKRNNESSLLARGVYMDVFFEWDPPKASANLRKHGISFDEASTVFNGPLAAIFDDEDTLKEKYEKSSSVTPLKTI
jgi:hypothetical protein